MRHSRNKATTHVVAENRSATSLQLSFCKEGWKGFPGPRSPQAGGEAREADIPHLKRDCRFNRSELGSNRLIMCPQGACTAATLPWAGYLIGPSSDPPR
eukprot:756711-Hanusia_phi.AAC.6